MGAWIMDTENRKNTVFPKKVFHRQKSGGTGVLGLWKTLWKTEPLICKGLRAPVENLSTVEISPKRVYYSLPFTAGRDGENDQLLPSRAGIRNDATGPK